jgi:protein TonB
MAFSTPPGRAEAAGPGTEQNLNSRRRSPFSESEEPHSLAVFTLVLWLLCVIVGALGFMLHYERPRPPAPLDQPILAQQIPVELTQVLIPPPDPEPRPLDPLAPPPAPDAMTPRPIAQPIAVALPSPAMAFALPVEGPTRVVEAKRAAHVAPPVTNASAPAPAAPPLVRPLTFGQGEGKQPAPPYPPSARSQGQEGTVVVRFRVGADGRVVAAEPTLSSPWPLLNEAAVRTVREKWRFRSGPPRIYEVAIRFELTK